MKRRKKLGISLSEDKEIVCFLYCLLPFHGSYHTLILPARCTSIMQGLHIKTVTGLAAKQSKCKIYVTQGNLIYPTGFHTPLSMLKHYFLTYLISGA